MYVRTKGSSGRDGRYYSLCGHCADACTGAVLAWHPEGVHDVDTGVNSASITHIVGYVVEVEQPVHEVATYTELAVCSVGIAHGSELACLEAMEGIALALREVTAAEKPLFALDGRLLTMTVIAKGECAV